MPKSDQKVQKHQETLNCWSAAEVDKEEYQGENKENIDPNKYGGSNVWTFSRLL